MRMGRTGIGATPSSRRFRIFRGFLRPFRNKKMRQKIEGTILNFRTIPRSPDRRDLRVHQDWRFSLAGVLTDLLSDPGQRPRLSCHSLRQHTSTTRRRAIQLSYTISNSHHAPFPGELPYPSHFHFTTNPPGKSMTVKQRHTEESTTANGTAVPYSRWA